MFHYPPEVQHPDMEDMKKSPYPQHNLVRGFRQYPSLKGMHHSVKEITESEYEQLKTKFPQLPPVEGKARYCEATYVGLRLVVWEGRQEDEWVGQYKPLLAKVETPKGTKFFAGFEPDWD